MDKFTDKLCGLIVGCARVISAIMPALIGLAIAYFIVVFIAAICIN